VREGMELKVRQEKDTANYLSTSLETGDENETSTVFEDVDWRLGNVLVERVELTVPKNVGKLISNACKSWSMGSAC